MAQTAKFAFVQGALFAAAASMTATAAAAQVLTGSIQEPAPVIDAFYGDTADTSCTPTRAGVECMVLFIDHISRYQLDGEIGVLLVGNPAIADVNLITATDVAITARSVGSTNLIFLDDAGGVISEIEVVVREADTRRVVLRRGAAATELYQCAPRCERTLTQMDSPEPHSDLAGTIGREAGAAGTAAGDSGQ